MEGNTMTMPYYSVRSWLSFGLWRSQDSQALLMKTELRELCIPFLGTTLHHVEAAKHQQSPAHSLPSCDAWYNDTRHGQQDLHVTSCNTTYNNPQPIDLLDLSNLQNLAKFRTWVVSKSLSLQCLQVEFPPIVSDLWGYLGIICKFHQNRSYEQPLRFDFDGIVHICQGTWHSKMFRWEDCLLEMLLTLVSVWFSSQSLMISLSLSLSPPR